MITDRERKAIIRDTLKEVFACIEMEDSPEVALGERIEQLEAEINPECACPPDKIYDSHLPPCPMAGTYGWEKL